MNLKILFIKILGKNLMMKFLKLDPNERIELKDALNHPWIEVIIYIILKN